MPHKRNPILTENLTGLARLVRSSVVPAMENVALWHERDISHSSVERGIAPDATITLDFALNRLEDEEGAAAVYEGKLNLTAEDIDGPVDLVVSDLSFISLRLVLAPLAGVCRPGAELLLMVKPQFEVGRRALPRSGVVTDPDARRDAVAGVAAAALGAGLAPRGLTRSGLAGQDGNAEFFLRLHRPDATAADDPAGGTSPAPDAGERAAGWVRGAHIDWS